MLKSPAGLQCGSCNADHSGRHGASEDPSGDNWSPTCPTGSRGETGALFRNRTPGRGSSMTRNTKRIGALGTATVAVMGAGLAYAAWTADGTGSGTVLAKTAQA